MTVEELEIIIKAKVEEARSNIKKFTKDVKKELDTLNNATNKINLSSNINKEVESAKKVVNNASKDISKTMDTLKSKATYVFNGMFSGIDTKKLDEIKAKFGDVLKFEEGGRIGVKLENVDEVVDFMDKIKAFDNEEIKPKVDLSEAQKQVASLQSSMGSTTTAKVDVQSSGSAPKLDTNASLQEITTLRQAFGNVIGEMQRQFPTITTSINKALEGINANPIVSKIGAAVNEAVQKLSALSNMVRVDTSNWINTSPLINKATSAVNGVKNAFSQGMGKLGNIGNSLAIPFDMLKSKANEVKSKVQSVFDTIKSGASKATSGIKSIFGALTNFKKKFDDVNKSTKNIGNIGNVFEKGVSSVKRFAMGLLSVQTAYSLVSKAAQSYLSYDTQLSDSIQNSWNVLGSLLAPALEYVASLFSKVVSYIAAFVKALTGIDLVARANAKGLKNQADATKKATKAQQENRQLSGLDDLNNLTTNQNTDSGSGSDDFKPITVEPIDTSAVDAFADKVKSAFEVIKEHALKLFEPVKASWDTYGASMMESLKNAGGEVVGLAGAIYQSFENVWTNGTGQEFMDNLFIGFTNIFDIVGGIAGSVADVWTQTGLGEQIIQLIFDNLNENAEIVNTVGGYFKEWVLSDTFKSSVESVLSVVKSILEFTKLIKDSLLEWVTSEDFKKALDAIFQVIDDILKWIKEIAEWLLEMYEKYAKPVLDNILGLITDLINTIKLIWDTVKPIVDKIIEQIEKFVEPIIKDVSKAINDIINAAKGVLEFIQGVFTGDWKKAFNGLKDIISNICSAIKNIFKAAFDYVWGIVKGILNAIIGGFESMINLVIKGLNALLKPLTKVGNAILKAVGIKNFSFKEIGKVSLPRLATGNVAYDETLAVFGEYSNAKSNPEITSPVSLMRETFREVLSEFELGGTRVDRLCINYLGKNVMDENLEYINEQQKIKGVQIIKDGGY